MWVGHSVPQPVHGNTVVDPIGKGVYHCYCDPRDVLRIEKNVDSCYGRFMFRYISCITCSFSACLEGNVLGANPQKIVLLQNVEALNVVEMRFGK